MAAVIAPRPTVEERIRAALWFAAHGFGVFSVWSTHPSGTCRCLQGRKCEHPGKHPIADNGFKDATTDPVRIRTLLSAASEPNYGLVCPDGVFVLDVDGAGVARLAELEAHLGPLPPTLRTITANGQHVFLRWPADHPRPIGQLFGYVTRWGSGAGAGYVIGPRSVHPSGAVYAPASPVVEIAELPPAWAAAVVAPAPADENADVITVARGYVLPEPGYDGPRYDAILAYVGSRYRRGISRDEIWAGVVSVLAPRFADPLTEAGLRSRFDRAWKTTPARFGDPLPEPESEATIADAAAAAPRPAAAIDDWPTAPDPAAFHGPLGAVVGAVADHTEADPVAILGSLLASVGACMGPHRYLYQGSAQAPNLFVVLVGESSSGRKGTAGSIAREVMNRAYPDWRALIVAGLGSGEGLVAYLKKHEKQNEPRALVMESEFGRLLTVMGREGSTLSPMVRDAWDGVPMGRILAREQDIVPLHHVGMIGHVTPVELRAKLSSTDLANGFGNRFLWLAVRRTRLVPFPASPTERAPRALFDAIGAAIEAAQSPAELTWSAAAADAWEDLYVALTLEPRIGLYGSLIARAEAQIVRLALVYALLDRSSMVDTAHLAAAVALWRYAERSIASVFGRSTGNRHADELLRILRDGPLGREAAKRELGIRTAADLQDAINVLRAIGAVETVKVVRDGGGRPAEVLRLAGVTTNTTQTTPVPAQKRGPESA